MACDPKDDVIDNYASLSVGVAEHLAKNEYSEKKWLQFYEGLKFIYDMDESLY